MMVFAAGGLVNFSSDWSVVSWQCLVCEVSCASEDVFSKHVRGHQPMVISVHVVSDELLQHHELQVFQYGCQREQMAMDGCCTLTSDSHDTAVGDDNVVAEPRFVGCQRLEVKVDEVKVNKQMTGFSVVGVNTLTTVSGPVTVDCIPNGDDKSEIHLSKMEPNCKGAFAGERLRSSFGKKKPDVHVTESCSFDELHEQAVERFPRSLDHDVVNSNGKMTDNGESVLTYECDVCGWQSVRHFNYHRHMLKHFGAVSATSDDVNGSGVTLPPVEGVYKCRYCSKAIWAGRGACGYGARRRQCQLCAAPPMFESSYVVHQYRAHAGPKPLVYACPACNYKTFKQSNYAAHCQRHHNVDVGGRMGRRRACPRCHAPPMFPSSYALHAYRAHAGPKPPEFECDGCGYRSFKRSNYVAHCERYHADDGRCTRAPSVPITAKTTGASRLCHEYSCNLCDFTTRRHDCLQRHNATSHQAEGSRALLSCPSCSYIAFDVTALRKHQLRHRTKATDSRLRCRLCSLGVAGGVTALRSHLATTHTHAAAFVCDLCGELCDDDATYWRHREAVHGERAVFVCTWCGHTTRDRDALAAHTASEHPGGGAEEEPGKGGRTVEEPGGEATVEEPGRGWTVEGSGGGRAVEEPGGRGAVEEPGGGTVEEPEGGTVEEPGGGRIAEEPGGSFAAIGDGVPSADSYPCARCDKVFGRLRALTCHLRADHAAAAGRPDDCAVCGVSTGGGPALRHHEQTHHAVRYVCDVCGLSMRRKWNLCRHKEVRHEQSLQKCSLCDYSSKSHLRLAKHYTGIHWVEVPPALQAVLSQQARRPANSKPQHGCRRPYEDAVCDICGKTVKQPFLKKHQESHAARRLFSCHHAACCYHANTTLALSRHIQQRHLVSEAAAAAAASSDGHDANVAHDAHDAGTDVKGDWADGMPPVATPGGHWMETMTVVGFEDLPTHDGCVSQVVEGD